MSSIIEMPELVMEKIIWFLDFRSVLTLRQVCQDFRNFIDDLKDSKLPDSKFKEICVYAENGDNIISIDFVDFDGSSHTFEYSESKKSRQFHFHTQKTIILENSDIVDVAIRDLEWIRKFQKSILERLYFCFNDSKLSNDLWIQKFSVKLSDMFENINRRFKTEDLRITMLNQSNMMSVLPLVDPDELWELNLETPDAIEIEINEITKTEQWKKAKIFNCGFPLLNLKVEDICHFSLCTLKTNSLSARELDFLRKTYISSPKFDDSWLSLNHFNERKDISELWGPGFNMGHKSQWYFRMKDNENEVLRIEIYEDNDIQFDVTEMRYVLDGAIVHDYNEI